MADEKFHLVSNYAPTGDQPQAIQQLVEGVERGDRCQTLLGVTGSGKTFTMANVIAQCNRPTLVLAHNKTLAAQLCTEFRSFFPDNAVEYFVSGCAIRRRRLCPSGGTSSLWRRCPASIRWATPSTTAAWSSASAPAWKWSGMSCASGW